MNDQAKSTPVEYQESTPGSSHQYPAPVGTTVRTSIERGNVYLRPTLYNVPITLMEVIRGKEAVERLQAQGISGEPSKADYEYVLAKISFGYYPRGKGGKDADYKLVEGQFTAISKDGVEYEAPSVTKQPQPSLIDCVFEPGSTHEGWLLLQVPETDERPLLIYKREHIEGAYSIWGYVWFQLW